MIAHSLNSDSLEEGGRGWTWDGLYRTDFEAAYSIFIRSVVYWNRPWLANNSDYLGYFIGAVDIPNQFMNSY
ncbi:MAG: hypothetical protein JW755_06500 [Candidatus Aminicenantes bacterium]|nr:hypothetical protein [Candidatus Aminicenantes bacterium]